MPRVGGAVHGVAAEGGEQPLLPARAVRHRDPRPDRARLPVAVLPGLNQSSTAAVRSSSNTRSTPIAVGQVPGVDQVVGGQLPEVLRQRRRPRRQSNGLAVGRRR